MNRTALLVALIVASLGGFLLYGYFKKFEFEASGGDKVKVLVARKQLEPGAVINEDMLTTQLVPQAYVESRAVRETEKAKILGLRMTTPVAAQQTVMWTDLAIAADDKRDLSALVAPGMRAVAVRAANDDKSFALIRPGDRVDVVATMSAKEGSSSERQAIVLLQSVLVLAVGIDTSQEISSQKGSTESRDLLLHLSLNLPEAQMVALAAEKGRISVALRNPDDVKALEGIADLSSTTLTDRGSRKVVQDFRVNQGRPIKLPSGAPQ